ncbi:NWD2 [Microsporum canis CBS 113480]|uniref:NWD2 n=1 Tax=Arthroderma otae (strain ATCC MYA-4605 / CBS 113480) TaxID=554155 RepID=C5FT45_ARTOC|nr:NWD2 [Microsporum canis CBS 113480]EEQ33048.1 NWD2 [Microsporum canis CBS 113480]
MATTRAINQKSEQTVTMETPKIPGSSETIDHPSPDSASADAWSGFMEDFRRPIDKHARRATQKVKVAILDSGIDMSYMGIREKDKKRIKGRQDFVLDKDTKGAKEADTAKDEDPSHHGTHVAILLLKYATLADIYVARVTKSKTSELRAECVSKAIEHAVGTWGVDIISMSMSFRSEHPIVGNAIIEASKKEKIIFVAACNDGANLPKPSFPANMPEVICINATDGHGNLSKFNPPPRKGYYNFGTLGEAIYLGSSQSTSSQGFSKRVSGTSFATPLAAAIAANFIEFLRQSQHRKFKVSDELRSQVKTKDGMLKIFAVISEEVQDFHYLKPWSLLECNVKPGETCKEKCKEKCKGKCEGKCKEKCKEKCEVIYIDKCGDECKEAREKAAREISEILSKPLRLLSNPDTPTLTHVGAADTWARSSTEQCICWISGRLGTGKSTIARTIALQYSEQGYLGGTFFFSKNERDLNTRDKFVSTIAHQLTKLSPTLKLVILNQKRDEPEVEQLAMGMQWEKLIHIPLSQLKSRDDPIIIVLDAVDECEDLDKVALMDIIDLSVRTAALENVRLRFIITSRPETHIHAAFAEFPQGVQHIALDELDKSTIDQDVSELFKFELDKLSKGNRGIEKGWPGDDSIKKLTERANGLFIYAAIVCRYIKGPGAESVKKRLTQVLEDKAFDTLDDMYNHILEQAVADPEEEQLREQFRAILGVIVSLFEPMPQKSLRLLCPENLREELELDVVCQRLGSLRSVLAVPESGEGPVYISHQSFREFLLRKREGGRLAWLNEQMHQNLFTTCLSLLSSRDRNGLRRDICCIKHPGFEISERDRERIDGSLLPHTLYACRRWVDHLEKVDPSQRWELGLRDNQKVHNFLQEHLLHWLEVLGLIGEVSAGIHAVQCLGSMIEAKESSKLYAFVKDARRFILYNRTIIEKAPLQVYYSALVFAPQQSLVRERFAKDLSNWIKRFPTVQPKWTPLRQTLGSLAGSNQLSHWHRMRVEFSEDGKLVTSTQEPTDMRPGKAVFRVWNATTGALLNTMESPKAIAFAPKERLAASLNLRNAVELRDVVNGRRIRVLQTQPHESEINLVDFSPDGKQVAAGTCRGLVHLWDVKTGHLLRTFVGGTGSGEGHHFHRVACSPDNKWVGARFWRDTCRVWNADDGSVVYNSGEVTDIVFLPDSKLAVVFFGTAQVLDLKTGSALYTIDGCFSIVLSPDGQLACSLHVKRDPETFEDVCRLSLRDAATGDETGVGIRPKNPRRLTRSDYATFTPNGKLVALYNDHASYLRLLDVTTGELTRACNEGGHHFKTVAFSPDSTVAALGSDDGLVRLWDIPTPAPAAASSFKGRLKRLWRPISTDAVDKYYPPAAALAFSPNRKLVASGAYGGPITIWDVATGTRLRESKSSYDVGFNSISWEDAKRLVACEDYRLIFLDAASLKEDRRIGGWSDIRAISPDGRMVAAHVRDSLVRDYFLRLFDSETREKLQELTGRSIHRVQAVAFSPDSKRLAVGCDSEVDIWNIKTAENMETMTMSDTVRERTFKALAFSADGEKLLTLLKGPQSHLLVEVLTGRRLRELQDCDIKQLFPRNTRDGYVSTNCGLLRISPSDTTAANVEPLFFTKSWATYDGCNVLWLPHEYRPRCLVVSGSVAVFGHQSGKVDFVEFDLAKMPKRADMRAAV